LLAIMLATGTMASWSIIDGAGAPALAQASVSVDFRTALQPYGRWEHHSRWGDVWVPENRPRGWRPYTVGRWAYTDDWGWYWASDEAEDAWGWIVYHYGRWVFDPDQGWVWVPGDEWSPGWVQWRRGMQYVGWAALPPEERVEIDERDQPDVWVFVHTHDFAAPRISAVIVPEREYAIVIRDTVVVNRTVDLRERHFAVNPGIAPGIIAAQVGRPIRSFEVHPRVLAGTARISGATEVRADELARGRERGQFRESLRETQSEIRPAANIAAPQPLGRGEQGRLGANPPRAAEHTGQAQPTPQGQRGQAPATQGQAGQRPQGPAPGRENAQQPPARPGTQGLAPRNQNEPGGRAQEQRQGPPQRERPSTQGLNPREQRGQNAQAARPEEQRPQAQPQREPPSTQGLNPREQRGPNPQGARPQEQRPQGAQRELPQREAPQREPPRTQGLGPREEQRPPGAIQQRPPQVERAPQAQPQREPPRTEGRGGPPGAGAAAQAPAAQAPRGAPPSAEGRGGGDRRGRPQP
jgi:hypothetical protein